MAIELRVPAVGESITEVLLVRWFKKEGDHAEKDEPLVEIETDKATFELPAPTAGTLWRIAKGDNQAAVVGEVIGYMEETAGAGAAATQKPAEPKVAHEREPAEQVKKSAKPEEPKPGTAGPAVPPQAEPVPQKTEPRVMPAARRELEQRGARPEQVRPTGPGGRVLKEDVLRDIGAAPAKGRESEREPAKDKVTETPPPAARTSAPLPAPSEAPGTEGPEPVGPITGEAGTPSEDLPGNRYEETVPMSPMRKRIAERLVQAQQTTALLTTFNEVDMSSVMNLRTEYRDTFQQKYNIKLGFMSFFVKACVDALKQYPQINAEVRGSDIVYHNYFDIGIAVSGGKGLVVPVIRNAERLSFAQIEMAVADFGARAKENKISLEELKGGTFTITNGGVFGSLLSTPIVNPPQSGILGMHAIQDRPVAREGQVVIRPMMYIALTYDHRIVDGREAVTFLKRIKEDIEDPSRMLMEV